MSYFVYILYSSQLNQYYTGHNADFDDRLYRHVNSGSKSTKKASNWKIVYTKHLFQNPTLIKEKWRLKSKKAEKYIEWLLAK
jgi:predicted GIY-YIG superfamily endonuclease